MGLPPASLRCGKKASWCAPWLAERSLMDPLRVSVGTTKQVKRFWKTFSLQEGLS